MSRRLSPPLPRRLPRLAAVPALLLALGAAGPAGAQSLQSLYEVARDYDASVQAARAQAESTVYRAEGARGAKRWQINGTGSVAYSYQSTPWAGSSGAWGRAFSTSAGVSAQQSLYNPSADRSIEQAERGIEVGRVQYGAAESDLIVRLTQAYFDVLSATDALDTVRASKRAITEQLASAKRNFEVGTATITDTREAEARFDLARAQELAAENDLNNARLALEQLVGRTELKPHPLRSTVPPALQPDDVDEWVRRADDSNPQLRQLRLALDVARLETEKARADGGPRVSASAALTGTRNQVAGPFNDGRSGYGPSASLGLQVTVPLSTGQVVQNRIKETLALEDKARADLEAARRTVAQAVRTAFFGVRSLSARIGALEAAESSSRLALEATQLGYKVGVRVNLDVLNAQTQLNQAQRDLAKARYDLIVAQTRLRQAAGVLQPTDVAAVDALLAR